jgi:hypothetical protein
MTVVWATIGPRIRRVPNQATARKASFAGQNLDAPERIRTSDLRFRRPTASATDMALGSQISHPDSPETRQKLHHHPPGHARFRLESGCEVGAGTDDRVSSDASIWSVRRTTIAFTRKQASSRIDRSVRPGRALPRRSSACSSRPPALAAAGRAHVESCRSTAASATREALGRAALPELRSTSRQRSPPGTSPADP